MRTAPARVLPGTGTPPEALIKEARRRQRRRRVTTAGRQRASTDSAQHRHYGADVASRLRIVARTDFPAAPVYAPGVELERVLP
jgi:hypothetical protein